MPDLGKLELGWYCFKALPKKEHIAAQLLSKVEGMEALCPRISYLKKTKRGKVRFIECLFPGYLFVRADLKHAYRLIRSIQGIRDVVSFGDRVPVLPDAFVEDLKSRIGEESTKTLPDPVIQAGQLVTVIEGPFKDLKAIVSGELSSQNRVALLLQFLGREMEVSVPLEIVMPEGGERKTEIWES
jgi:transcriptional antiterminator RfaH